MSHTKQGGIYHALWGGLTLGFWFVTIEVLTLGPMRTLDMAILNTPGAVWSLLLSMLTWFIGIPFTLFPTLLKKEFTPRQVGALAVVMSGTLVLLSVALGWDLSLMTKGPLFPNIITSAAQYFKWMLGGTLAGTVFWLVWFAAGNVAAAGWKKLAGG